MADVRGAWNETGDKLTELGRRLKLHYDEQKGGEAQQSREEIADAARRLGAAVQDAFEAIGTAARDREVKEDVKQVGQSLVEALGATLGQATGDLKRAFAERKGSAAAGPVTTPEAVVEPVVVAPVVAEPVVTPTVVTDPLVGEPPPGVTSEAQATPERPDDEQPPKVEPWGTP